MVSSVPKRFPRWARSVALGAVLGLAAGLALRWGLGTESGGHAPDGTRDDPTVPEVAAAVAYARAYQEGDWDYVIDHTLWMQERIAYARAHGEATEPELRLTLAEDAANRSPAGNHLLDGGVADQYVFRPGATLEVVRTDGGREDLARPAASRTWVRVRYPNADNALLDSVGLPLASLVVGINLDAGGRVLKASVYGNVEIDFDSLTYRVEETRDGG